MSTLPKTKKSKFQYNLEQLTTFKWVVPLKEVIVERNFQVVAADLIIKCVCVF